jgi:hypothetical protein
MDLGISKAEQSIFSQISASKGGAKQSRIKSMDFNPFCSSKNEVCCFKKK